MVKSWQASSLAESAHRCHEGHSVGSFSTECYGLTTGLQCGVAAMVRALAPTDCHVCVWAPSTRECLKEKSYDVPAAIRIHAGRERWSISAQQILPPYRQREAAADINGNGHIGSAAHATRSLKAERLRDSVQTNAAIAESAYFATDRDFVVLREHSRGLSLKCHERIARLTAIIEALTDCRVGRCLPSSLAACGCDLRCGHPLGPRRGARCFALAVACWLARCDTQADLPEGCAAMLLLTSHGVILGPWESVAAVGVAYGGSILPWR